MEREAPAVFSAIPENVELQNDSQPELIVFSEEDADITQKLVRLPNTQEYGLRKFPSPEQYYGAVAELSEVQDSPSTERLCALAQRDWHVRGQNGCMFARLAALKAEELGWNYTVTGYEETEIDAQSALAVGETVDRMVGDSDTEVHSLLFPGINDPKQAVSALGELVDNSKFWLERNEVSDSLLRLNLRYPVGDTGIQAWVMAFGPFEFLPNTRKSPYFELAIRVKPKPEKIFHRLNQDPTIAHLADAPLAMPEKYWEHRFDSTLRRTRMILGGEPDDISAAKATLAIPIESLDA